MTSDCRQGQSVPLCTSEGQPCLLSDPSTVEVLSHAGTDSLQSWSLLLTTGENK